MRFLFLFLGLGCSMHRTTMTGAVDVIEGEWVVIEITNSNNAKAWVKLNKKNFRGLKEGDKVVFYVKPEAGKSKQ